MSVAYNSLVYPHPDDLKPQAAKNPETVPIYGTLNGEEHQYSSTRRIVEEDKKSTLHYPSLLCIMSIGFIANCEYGVVMPSIWNYLESIGGNKSELGYALAASSFAQLCFLPLFGFWSDKRNMREVITVSMIIGIAGNVLYALAGYFQSPYCIIAGRTLTGIYMGVISVTNSFVALVTTPQTRTKFMAQLNGINAIGMVSGPGFNVFLNLVNFKIGNVPFDSKTNPGWFIACLVFISCIAFFIFFREPKAPSSKRMDPSTNAEYNHIGSFKQQQITAKQYLWFILTAFLKPYGACFIICFVQNFDFSVLETIATVLTNNFYGFGPFRNSLFYSALSLEMVIIIFITAAASRMGAQDRVLLLIAQAFVGAGSIGMLIFYTRGHPEFWKFCLFAALLIAGIPSQNISVMSTYSKLLTAEFGQAKQGLYTGMIMIFGSLARILGPIWGGQCMEANKLVLLFSLLVGMWAFDVLFTVSFYRKLKPPTPVGNDERVSLLAH